MHRPERRVFELRAYRGFLRDEQAPRAVEESAFEDERLHEGDAWAENQVVPAAAFASRVHLLRDHDEAIVEPPPAEVIGEARVADAFVFEPARGFFDA